MAIADPHRLSRIAAVLLLFIGLLARLEVLYACELAGGPPQRSCCCDEHLMAAGCEQGGGCETTADGSMHGCCKVTLDAPVEVTATTVPAQLVTLIEAPQPPPVVACSAPAPQPACPAARPCTSFNTPPPALWGTATYLITERLRI